MKLSTYLLGVATIIFFFVFFANPKGTFLEFSQFSLLGFVLITIGSILLNRKFKNVFLELINIILVIFFLLRIPFIYSEDVFSDVIIRSADFSKVNFAIQILNYQVIMLVICTLLISPKMKLITTVKNNEINWKRILNYTFGILIINLFFVIFFLKLGVSNLPNIISIFLAIFTYTNILIFLVPLLVLANKQVNWKYRFFIYLQLLIIVFLVMYSGSKSGLFQVLSYVIISVLAIKGTAEFKISLKHFLGVIFIAIIGMALFMLGTIANQAQRGMIETGDVYGLFLQSMDNMSIVVNSVSSRIGYFDYYIDKTIQNVYFSAFELDKYLKAFIDAVTPGFDLFNVPLVSRSVYNNMFGNSEGPNSEVVTVFAEAYHLAGYFSFFVYGFVFYIIRIFVNKYASDPFRTAIKSVFLLFIFLRYMLGIGIDYWLFGDVIYPYIFVASSLYIIYYPEISAKRKPNLGRLEGI